MQGERRRLQHEVMARAQAAIKEAESEFKAIVQRLRQGGESWGRLRQEFSRAQGGLLEAVQPVAAPAPASAPRFAPGQQVFLPALGLTGEVLVINKDGRMEVQVRKVRLRVSPEEIAPAEGQADGGNGGQAGPYALPPASLPSLNLVGLRVDEALPLVDRRSTRPCCTARNGWI